MVFPVKFRGTSSSPPLNVNIFSHISVRRFVIPFFQIENLACLPPIYANRHDSVSTVLDLGKEMDSLVSGLEVFFLSHI